MTTRLNSPTYLTTMGSANPLAGTADAPVEPWLEGPWELIGSTATPTPVPQLNLNPPGVTGLSGVNYYPVLQTIALFWFWRRVAVTRPCAKCGAVAQKDGQCLNCETKPSEVRA